MRVWCRAMHLLAQGKKGLSNIELGRRLGISTNAAWRVQHKLMQAMIERDRRYKLGTGGPRIEIDDAYIGGERTGEGSGRGRRGHTPFIIAVETTADGRPLYARLQVVRGFQTAETKRLCARVEPGTTVVSDDCSFRMRPPRDQAHPRYNDTRQLWLDYLPHGTLPIELGSLPQVCGGRLMLERGCLIQAPW